MYSREGNGYGVVGTGPGQTVVSSGKAIPTAVTVGVRRPSWYSKPGFCAKPPVLLQYCALTMRRSSVMR